MTIPLATERLPIRRERPIRAHELDVTLDRPIPQSPDAERATLGAILINNHAYYRVIGIVDTDDFFKDAHRTIFAAMKRMALRQEDIETLTLKQELSDQHQLDQAGGVAYISALLDVVPDVANVERYAKIVKRMANLRGLVVLGSSIKRSALDGVDEPEEIASEALVTLSGKATKQDAQARPIIEIIREAYVMQDRRLRGEDVGWLTTGRFPALDFAKAIRRTLVVVGCASKMGKTSFAINIADALTANRHSACLFSLESSEYEAAMRYVSMNSGVAHGRVQDWTLLRDGEMARLLDAEKNARDKKFFATRRIRTVEGIINECRRLKTLGSLDAVLIDYVQIVRTEERFRDREERIAYVCQSLLELSADLEMLVLITSQVNKDRLNRESGRLYMEDLKYGAVIGETARVGMLFTRPHMVDKNPNIKPCLVEPFQLEANNENVTNDIPMHFSETTQRFGEGTCEDNDCPSLWKDRPAQQKLI